MQCLTQFGPSAKKAENNENPPQERKKERKKGIHRFFTPRTTQPEAIPQVSLGCSEIC